MKVGLWAEIRRLAEIEKLSARVISRRLHCSWRTVALRARTGAASRGPRPQPGQPPGPVQGQDRRPAGQVSRTLGSAHPRRNCSWPGRLYRQRDYRPPLRPVNPAPRGRVYQEVHYEPAQAMQVDWGECGRVQVGDTSRKVSVLVAVLCYSRMTYIEFTLSQRKAEFYRCLVHALEFFGPGRPGWLPTQAPHRSGLARQMHPARHLTSLRHSVGREPLGHAEVCNASPYDRILTTSRLRLGVAETAVVARSRVLPLGIPRG